MGLFEGGVIMTLLVSFWDKVRAVFWNMASLVVCRQVFSNTLARLAIKFTWYKVRYKTSLLPQYTYQLLGSGAESRIFIREIGFRNLRLIWIGKVPVLVKMGIGNNLFMYSLRLFITNEQMIRAVINYYYENNIPFVADEVQYSRFTTDYIRGSLGKLAKPHDDNTKASHGGAFEDGDNADESHPSISLRTAETWDVGNRLNYTAADYKKYTTYLSGDIQMLDILYMSDPMKNLENKLTKWFNNKAWFQDRGIQWKRGVLLHGKPGTGKTSTIVALAQKFNVPVFVLDIGTFTNDDMMTQWEALKEYTPCFVVLEDFDSVFEGRKNIATQNINSIKPLSFDCVLNVLDGAIKYDGIVTFITTNNLDNIDTALGGKGVPRPGRIDYVYETESISEDGRLFIADVIFKDLPNKEELIKKALFVNCDTPAQFKEYCINIALSQF